VTGSTDLEVEMALTSNFLELNAKKEECRGCQVQNVLELLTCWHFESPYLMELEAQMGVIQLPGCIPTEAEISLDMISFLA
jgi:hypothetical protein